MLPFFAGIAVHDAWKSAIGPEAPKEHEDWYRQAAAAGIALNAGRQGKLREKRHALATAARHGISALHALTHALQGKPWIPETG